MISGKDFIEKYSRFYETYMDVICKPNHAKCFIDQIFHTFVPFIKNQVVLEMGPCSGYWTMALLEAGAKHIIGIEKYKPFYDDALKMFDIYNVDSKLYTYHLDELPWCLDHIDYSEATICTMFGVIYHTYDHAGFAHRLWDSNIQTVLIESDMREHRGLFMELSPYPEVLRLTPNKESLMSLFQRVGFQCYYPPFPSWNNYGQRGMMVAHK